MKKRVGIAAAIILLASVTVFIAFLIFDAYHQDDVENPVKTGEDMAALVKQNADTAFAFLNTEEKKLPDNMRGYFVDPAKDIDISDTSREALKAAVCRVFDKVDAIKPNTVAVSLSAKGKYDLDGFDYVSFLVQEAHAKDMTVILFLPSEQYSENAKSDKLAETAEIYGADAVAVEVSGLSAKTGDKLLKLKNELNEKNIFFGAVFSEKAAAKAEVEAGHADFYFVRLDSSTETGLEKTAAEWTAAAVKSPAKVYAVLRNDLVCSGSGYTKSNEMNEQLRLLYNGGGFDGALMASHQALYNNDHEMTVSLYSYYEYFGNSEYTALTLTDFAIRNKDTAVFKGESDSAYPVYVWSSAVNAWVNIPASGEKGTFTAEIPLQTGKNKILLRHKNALYTYSVTRAVDVMTACSAVIADGAVTLSASAVKGARVWASLANTTTVELTPTGEINGDYERYALNMELPQNLALLKDDQISFAAAFNGLQDIVMCTEEKQPSIYADNGLGRADMCMVTRDHAETTPAAAQDDTSAPTCTPQLAGSAAYVNGFAVSDNHIIYTTETGFKIYADDTELVIDGFVLPENTVTLNAVTQNNGTVIDFSVSYKTFTKIFIEPQTYRKGFLDRIYNVDSFEGEYIDIMFADTAVCMSAENIDFSSSEVVDRHEWYANKAEKTVTLRLYLKNKGVFNGYVLTTVDNGHIRLLLKNDKKTLNGCVIMLDPGHGGYGSPGTNSGMSIYEKDITLAIAEQAAEMLREHGATVILTRSGDDAVFLPERVAMARSVAPDVFVSIHCDGADNTAWSGTHTFYYKNFSMPLADSIHKQLVGAYRNYYYTDPNSAAYKNVDMGIKFFPYQVARIEECPSVLVECGYLTNEQDTRFLSDKNGQKVIATALAQGIVDYIERY